MTQARDRRNMADSVEKGVPYDPLDYGNLARNVVGALMGQPISCLPPPAPFEGMGVYAIYYDGDLEWYGSIRGLEVPIYVGSAVPAGKRKGAGMASSRSLYNRLAQHSRSIEQTENLQLSDFQCRYLVVVPVWIGLAERFLIEHYQPVWNTVIDGFGNHDPGAGRKGMKRPLWDVIHPGRTWAMRLRAVETLEEILARVKA